MKITAQFAFWTSLLFGLVCLAAGLHGLYRAPGIAEEATRADAHGFAWFWLFLASIALLTALVSWLMAKGKLGRLE